MYSRSAKGGEKADPNRNPWLAKMPYIVLQYTPKSTQKEVKFLFQSSQGFT